MKLQKVNIENFRCFESYKVSFAENTTVLIGKNGTGKTNLITALKKGMSFIFSRKNVGVQNFLALSSDLHITKFSVFDSRFDNEKRDFNYPINIALEASINKHQLNWTFAKRSSTGSISESGYKDALKQFFNQYSGVNTILPVLAFFSDSYPHIRINISKNTDEIIKKQGAMPKSFGYYQWDADTNCAEIWQRRFIKVYNDVNDYKKSPIALQDEIDFLETLIRNKDEHDEHKIPEWEEKIEILQEQIEQLKNKPQNNKEVEEINFVEYYLKIFTEPLRNDLNFINKEFQIRNIYVSRPKGGDFNIQFAFVNGNVMFFDNLPQGYKRLFSIVFDIAYRSYILNQAKEPEGIVFIDEIELHLHPSLQQEVLGRLRKTFPKIQFIVSTHSLLVISNLKSENNSNKIIRLENDGLTYSNEPVENIYGIDYTTGLMDIMDAPYRPSTIDNLIDSYVILKLRNKEDDALKIWNEIFLVVGKDNKRIEKEITDKLEANR
ncbi:MAG: AAA family ATPase [Chitinophagales bacterium]|jgi:predicted ATP-binding protein involved in virulence|nr:AAA family ATPase [Chitinophagales bacterium]